jgi:hypothetical protein
MSFAWPGFDLSLRLRGSCVLGSGVAGWTIFAYASGWWRGGCWLGRLKEAVLGFLSRQDEDLSDVCR